MLPALSIEVAFKHKTPSVAKDSFFFSPLATISTKHMRTLSTSANFWFEQQSSAFKASYASFLAQYPAYKDTAILDRLRKDEFSRLDKAKEVYLDYMGGCLWPKVLVSRHASILKSGLFGDANSDSPW
jgi:hypothetical protein